MGPGHALTPRQREVFVAIVLNGVPLDALVVQLGSSRKLHVYAELVAAGGPAGERYPGVAAHLQACGPCGEDFEGLLAAIRGEAP